jgi:tRNA G18 (ribose-2'-O)-methylase SpoU
LPEITLIDDPDDPRIAVFRAVRERDVAGRRGGFIAEGEVVLRVLARSRLHTASSILIAQKRISSLTELLERFSQDTPIYAAEQKVMDAIAGFAIHRGILAFGRRGPEVVAEALLKGLDGPGVVLALFGISNHDNMGGIFRNAAAFGARAVLLDAACCDPLYRKAIRVSVGAALEIPFSWLGASDDPLALLSQNGFEALALSPNGETRLSDLQPPLRAAVLLGAEGAGLPTDVLTRARTVRLPMSGAFDSLNVATTSGIVLHHLATAISSPGRRLADR